MKRSLALVLTAFATVVGQSQTWTADVVFAPALESPETFTHSIGVLPVPGNKVLLFTPNAAPSVASRSEPSSHKTFPPCTR